MNLKQSIERHFKDFGFEWQDSVPIVSANPQLLFNISGGVVFEDVISHGAVPKRPRVVSIQTCLRTDGWKKIGLSGRHHLAFDMLGHFSLYEGKGPAVKEVMIESAWRYLTDCLGIGPSSLSATVHPQDEVSQKIWERLGVTTVLNDENITITPTRNRCGVRTEIVWHHPSTQTAIELWNLVFTEFQGDTAFVSPLEKIAADSGASIDRLVTAVEGCNSDYGNSNWKDVITTISEQSGVKEQTMICRLADLGKATILLIAQGLRPGNKAADYVLRKLIREAYVICLQVSLPFEWFGLISGSHWTSAEIAREIIRPVLVQEILKFEQGLERGRKEYAKLTSQRQGSLAEQDIVYLADTFGYPKALIELEESRRKEGTV